MSYIPQTYIQQPQATNNVLLQSTPQSYVQPAAQIYYDATSHSQQVYAAPTQSIPNQVTSSTPGNTSNYYQMPQGQYNQENVYISNQQWSYQQTAQSYSYQPQVQQSSQPQAQVQQNVVPSQQVGYQNVQQNYTQTQQSQIIASQPTTQYTQAAPESMEIQSQQQYVQSYSQYQPDPASYQSQNFYSQSSSVQQGGQQTQYSHNQAQSQYSQPQQPQQDQSKSYVQSQANMYSQPQQNQFDQSQQSQQDKYSGQQGHYKQSQTRNQHEQYQYDHTQQNRYSQAQQNHHSHSEQGQSHSYEKQQGQMHENKPQRDEHGQSRNQFRQNNQRGQSQNQFRQGNQHGHGHQNQFRQSEQHDQSQEKKSQPQTPKHDQKDSNQQNDEQGPSKQDKCSPLNDFGDMGAAVRKYAQTVPKKPYFMDPSQANALEEKRKLDNNSYRQEHGLIVWDDKGDKVPDPFEHFEDVPGLKENEISAFYNAGFQAPTPIQAQTWPIVLKGRDVVSIAKTGSGKTLAFLLPGYQKIDAKFGSQNRKMIRVLVLAPTRELAVQIETESCKFGSVYGHQTACAYGGAPKNGQLQAINAGVSVLVATPGRLNDFLDSRQVNLSSVFYLVLDEADRMLDMGFEPQIRSILRRLPRQRQTLMFSATWPEEVRRLANDFLVNPIHIRLGQGDSLTANENIKQYLILLQSGEDKDGEIVSLLKSKISSPGDSILVFVARKNTCNLVANMLNRVGVSAAAMHGDRTQEFREETLAKFKGGKLPVLVATDVASRGLDVKGLVAVVNYDMPGSTEDYVHRIGRTGRAGLTGESYTFLTHSNEDIWKASSIVEVMEKTDQRIPDDVQALINQLKDRQKRNQEQRAAEDEQFSKVLMVAEKPSVAKMIADSLSNNGRYRTRKGKSRANQIFEFIKWFGPAQQKCKIMVTSVVGHIFGLSFENQRCPDVAMLFDAPVKKEIEDTSKKLCIVDHLQELANESEYLYLWLDCDREGENIGFEVISLCQGSIHYDNVYRARFSSLTTSELNYAFSNPIRPDKYAAMSVDARQELDLKIGVAFTRLMTRTYLDQARTKFRLKDQKCISYGPCQTPTLWFCAQRHKEIQAFQRKKYFELTVNINIEGRDCEFQYIQDKVEDTDEVGKIENAVNSAQNAVVKEVKEEQKKCHRPVGLNTVTLLKACSKGLGMSPTAAMHAAEHLYTSGYISYPRTETTAYSPSFDLISVLEEQANHPNWGRVVSYLLNNGRVNPPVAGHDAGDHPPITPVRAASRNEITKGNEWRIYDYVTRHFIASLHDDFEYLETKVTVNISGYDFCFTCHDVKERGFAFAMPWKEKSLNLKEIKLNSQQPLQGQSFPVRNFSKQENYTKPPDYLQESELISLMDKHGIGTDASIPQHIKNVQDRHYVDVCGPGEDGQKGTIIPVKKYFGKNNRGGGQQQQPRPTSRHMVPRGFGLAFLGAFEYLDNELCEPAIRGFMEKQITKIATGETEKSEVVSSNLKLFLNKFVKFRENLHKVDRYFLPKVFPDQGQGGNHNDNFNRPGFNNNFGNNGGGDRGRGRGGRGGGDFGGRGGRGGGDFGGRGGRGGGDFGGRGGRGGGDFGGRGGRGGRGGSFNHENRGRGFPSGRGKRGNQGFGNDDGFKRQKTWE